MRREKDMSLTLTLGLTSLLFVSGATPERLPKALATRASIACLDLEDSVPEAGKATARAAALTLMGSDPRVAIRINPVSTLAGLRDLVAFADAPVRPTILLLPKAESAGDVAIVRGALGEDVVIIPLIESPAALQQTAAIAASPGVGAMMFGGGDLAGDLGVAIAWEPLLAARGLFLLGCAQAGVPTIDVPFIALADLAGLEAETLKAHALGFQAKAAIHPTQVDVINAVLRPSAALIAEARAAEVAFVQGGVAAVRFGGKMLELPVMRRYRRILAQAAIEGNAHA